MSFSFIPSGPDPQGDILGLQVFLNYLDHGAAQALDLDLVPGDGRKTIDGPFSVVLAPIKTPVDKILNAPAQGIKQRGDGKRGEDDRQL